MIIFIILTIGFVLRLVNLNQSLWLDEAVQAITAKESLKNIFQEILGDFHPPLYHFLMHYWVMIFGDSEIALRMPSVLFGVGTIYILFRISNLSPLRHLSYLSVILLATSPFHIYYSQEARMYSMAAFLATLSMYFFIKVNGLTLLRFTISKASEGHSELRINGLYIFYLISTLCLIYTDYYGFLVFLAQAVYLLIKKKYKFLIISSLFLILCFLPWIPMFIKQIQTGRLATQTLPGWGKLVNVSFLKAIPLTLIKFTIGRITIFNKTIYAFISIGIIFFCGLIIAKGYFKGKKFLITNHQSLITLWFFIPLIISWISSLFVPNFQPFRLLLILPSFYLLIIFGISRIHTTMIYIIVVAVFLVNNLITCGIYFFNPYFQREDWKGLVGFLKQNNNSLVIIPSETSNWPIRYYDKENKIKLLGIGKEIREIGLPATPASWLAWRAGDIKDKKQIFYIRYLVPVFDPEEKILSELSKEGYNKVNEISYNQITIWEFGKVIGD